MPLPRRRVIADFCRNFTALHDGVRRTARRVPQLAVVFIYMSSKELSLGLSSGRRARGKVITNLPARLAPKTKRKNSSL